MRNRGIVPRGVSLLHLLHSVASTTVVEQILPLNISVVIVRRSIYPWALLIQPKQAQHELYILVARDSYVVRRLSCMKQVLEDAISHPTPLSASSVAPP